MEFVGREAESSALRALVTEPTSSLIRVTGPRGSGKSTLVLSATSGLDRVIYRAVPLPERRQLELLAAAAGTSLDDEDSRERSSDSWTHLFEHVAAQATREGAPRLLVIDDAHRLAETRARWRDPLAAVLRRAMDEGRRLHVIVISSGTADPWPEGLEDIVQSTIEVKPLTFRAAAPLLPGARPRDMLRAYAVFGGLPTVLRHLDKGVTVGTNIRRLMLDESQPLCGLAGDWLEREFQSPHRYYAIMATLASGEATWAQVHAGVPGLTTGGQVAPYMKRLQELGWVQTRRSLDAGSGGRARRYSITDPFLAHWFRFLFPRRFQPEPPDPRSYYAEVIKPALSRHIEAMLPSICRDFMKDGAAEVLGSHARELGSLWGGDYDLDVAGVLRSGAAFCGHCYWEGPPDGADPLEHLDAQMRASRYRISREARLRLLFSGRPIPRPIQREVARRSDTFVIGPEELLGSSRV